MKNKIIKNTIIAISLSIIGSCSVVQAATNKIPAHAEPGTNIKYDENNNMIVLKGSLKSTDSIINESSLPDSKPGMTVSYDGIGNPTYIKVNGKTYNENKVSLRGYSRGYKSDYGAISFYDDEKGQEDHYLTEYDCATDRYRDNCPLGTRICVQDRDTGIWGTFKKWDVGALAEQDEKRIVDIWNKDVFGEVFQIEDPEYVGLIHNGYYYHN